MMSPCAAGGRGGMQRIFAVGAELPGSLGADHEQVRVLIVDDHAIYRLGVRALLGSQPDITVVGDVDTGQEAVVRAAQLQPDVIVMDINLPDMSGIEATREIVRVSPHVGVLMLTM